MSAFAPSASQNRVMYFIVSISSSIRESCDRTILRWRNGKLYTRGHTNVPSCITLTLAHGVLSWLHTCIKNHVQAAASPPCAMTGQIDRSTLANLHFTFPDGRQTGSGSKVKSPRDVEEHGTSASSGRERRLPRLINGLGAVSRILTLTMPLETRLQYCSCGRTQ